MKIGKILVAVVLTILLLLIARQLSTRHPEDLVSEANGVRLEHRSITEQIDKKEVKITAMLQASESIIPVLHYRTATNLPYQEVTLARSGRSVSGIIPAGRRGDRAYYFLSVEDSAGTMLATLPADSSKPLLIKFKGKVASWVLTAHIVAMFGSIFFVLLAGMGAVDLLRGVGKLKVVVRNSVMALNLIFIGGFPLGIVVAYQTFGVGWDGVPFGWNITDNKTLIIFLFWLATVLVGFERLSRAPGQRLQSAPSPRSFALLVIVSVFVTLAVYLVPHSL